MLALGEIFFEGMGAVEKGVGGVGTVRNGFSQGIGAVEKGN